MAADFPFGSGPGIGSNNWVVSGAMTQSRKPMLADDTHLAVSLPSVWYAIALHTDGGKDEDPVHIAGLTMAPFPGVIAGHNGRKPLMCTLPGSGKQAKACLDDRIA